MLTGERRMSALRDQFLLNHVCFAGRRPEDYAVEGSVRVTIFHGERVNFLAEQTQEAAPP